MIPLMSTWLPNRITTAGSASWSRSSTVWSQVGQQLTGVRVAVAAAVAVPPRQLVDEDRLLEGRPPQLQVGRARDSPNQLTRDGSADSEVDVRRQPALRFDRAEVLHLVSRTATQVLHPAVKESGEEHRLDGGPPVVVPLRKHGRAGTGHVHLWFAWHHPAVGAQRQRHEHGGPIRLPVRSRERLPHRAVLSRYPRKWLDVSPPASRTHSTLLVAGVLRELSVQVRVVVHACCRPVRQRVVLEVPPLRALLHSETTSLLSTCRAHGLPSRPARDRHPPHVTGLPIGHLPHQRPHANGVPRGVVMHELGRDDRLSADPAADLSYRHESTVAHDSDAESAEESGADRLGTCVDVRGSAQEFEYVAVNCGW